MTYRTTIDVDAQRVQDMIIGAFEGGSTYWLLRADLIHPDRKDLPPDGVVWWGNSKRNVFAEPDFKVKLEIDDPDDPTHYLDADAIRKGLQIMAEKYGRHFGDMTSENDDATTSDVFLQCCLFGELVYG